ncbi:hypothetical protein P7C70_g8454, partial [Phenoliferia sp. Uapishka_3]
MSLSPLVLLNVATVLRPSTLRPLLAGTLIFLPLINIRSLQALLHPLTKLSPALQRQVIKWTKRAFTASVGLLTMTRETRVIVTGDYELFERDEKGVVVGLSPCGKHSLILANHQILESWRFIFVGATDQLSASDFAEVALEAQRDQELFSLLVFPEGAYTTSETRNFSAEYAKKSGLVDYENLIHPRSGGSYHVLETLARLSSDIQIIDATLAYPNVSQTSFASLHHSLESAFFRGTTDPVVHIHLRYFALCDLPFRQLAIAPTEEHDVHRPTNPERDTFDAWLRKLWREKDDMLANFREGGRLGVQGGNSDEWILRGGVQAVDALALADVGGALSGIVWLAHRVIKGLSSWGFQ